MFDYIKFDKGTYRLLMCIFIMIVFWIIMRLKRKTTTIFNTVMVYILIGFISSIIFYSLSQNQWYYFDSSDIDITPLLYLVFLFLILIMPFIFVDTKSITSINDKGVSSYLNFLATIIFVLSILPFINGFIKLFSLNYSTLVSSYEGESEHSSFIFYYSNQIRNYFKFFIAPLLFYYLYKGSSYGKYIRYMIFSLFTTMILAITSGARGTLVNELNYLVVCYIMFQGLLNEKVKKKIRRIGIIVGICVVIGLTIITFARSNFNATSASSQDKVNLVTWVSLYLGQGPLEFSRQMYPSTIRTEGDNSFSLVKSLIGLKTFKDNDERRAYWENKQTIQNFIFYTVIGDIYSDLGFNYTIVFCILISALLGFYFFKRKHKPITIPMVVIISIYFEWISMGFMTNCYKTYYQQFFIMCTLVICAFLSYTQKRVNK